VVQETTSGESFVYVLEDMLEDVGVVKRKIVKTGPSQNDMIEVTEGLKGSELIVDRGSRSVKEGQKVRLVKE
jgi:multidrug efflux pump subunit AcrA (membrane-fusion protein)